jgi:hypothetical protein
MPFFVIVGIKTTNSLNIINRIVLWTGSLLYYLLYYLWSIN